VSQSSIALRRRLWRWHFFAGLFVFPFLILLSITGSIYLFKPQIDVWEESRIHKAVAPIASLENRAPLSIDVLWQNVQANYPHMKLKRVTLAKQNDPTVEFELLPIQASNESTKALTLWIDRFSGKEVAVKSTNKRFLHLVKKLHSEVLLGSKASYVVELAASWCVVLIVSGFYLWVTGRGRSVTAKSSSSTTKVHSGIALRKRHAFYGVILALPILVLLFTGLPWTQLWGSGFKSVKETMGWAGPGQEWFVTLQSSSTVANSEKAQALFDSESLWEISDTGNKMGIDTRLLHSVPMGVIVEKISNEVLNHPIYLLPPKSELGVWTVRSMPQQRANRATLHFDQYSGEELMRIEFTDHHPVQRFISHGISLHEGALFGVLNQVLVLITALGAIFISSLGVVAWWRRRPQGRLAAPRKVIEPMPNGLILICVVLGMLLPAAGISFVLLYLVERISMFFQSGIFAQVR